MKIDEKQKKKRTTKNKLGPLHSHETRRGGGRSCWVKADKMFASRAKRKKKKRKRKEKCADMCEQTLPRQAQVILTATMHDVGIRCVDLGIVALPTALHLQRCLVSFIRGTCVLDSAVDFTGKKLKVVSVVVIFKIEVARDFYVTKHKNQHFLGCLSTSRLLEESSLRRATVADGCLRIAARNQTFRLRTVRSILTQYPSTSCRPSLKSPCRL